MLIRQALMRWGFNTAHRPAIAARPSHRPRRRRALRRARPLGPSSPGSVARHRHWPRPASRTRRDPHQERDLLRRARPDLRWAGLVAAGMADTTRRGCGGLTGVDSRCQAISAGPMLCWPRRPVRGRHAAPHLRPTCPGGAAPPPAAPRHCGALPMHPSVDLLAELLARIRDCTEAGVGVEQVRRRGRQDRLGDLYRGFGAALRFRVTTIFAHEVGRFALRVLLHSVNVLAGPSVGTSQLFGDVSGAGCRLPAWPAHQVQIGKEWPMHLQGALLGRDWGAAAAGVVITDGALGTQAAAPVGESTFGRYPDDIGDANGLY